MFDADDQAIVADPIFPQFAEAFVFQRLTDRAGVVERRDAVTKEAKNTLDGLRPQFVQLARSIAGRAAPVTSAALRSTFLIRQ